MFRAAATRLKIAMPGADDLVELSGKTSSGNTVRLNRRFMQAGFRILTGLVEPHFMAGFSGGRKAVCPGLADLATLHSFHGYRFLAAYRWPATRISRETPAPGGFIRGQPGGIDFTLNVVLNRSRQVVRAFAGDLEAAHEAACQFVAAHACPPVRQEASVAITSSGGYPLNATFYQCVKGFVSCLPAVKTGGTIIAFGGCREGIGSEPYTQTMLAYAGRWAQFLREIADARRSQPVAVPDALSHAGQDRAAICILSRRGKKPGDLGQAFRNRPRGDQRGTDGANTAVGG